MKKSEGMVKILQTLLMQISRIVLIPISLTFIFLCWCNKKNSTSAAYIRESNSNIAMEYAST